MPAQSGLGKVQGPTQAPGVLPGAPNEALPFPPSLLDTGQADTMVRGRRPMRWPSCGHRRRPLGNGSTGACHGPCNVALKPGPPPLMCDAAQAD